jgi:hypothetical protein
MREIQGQAKVRWANLARNAQNEANGQPQATIFKKCSTARRSPETNKACAGGTCQHACEPGELEACRHAWAVMYWVNGSPRG